MSTEKEQALNLLEKLRSDIDPVVFEFAVGCIRHHDVSVEEEKLSDILMNIFKSYKSLQPALFESTLFEIDSLLQSFTEGQVKNDQPKLVPLEAPMQIYLLLLVENMDLLVEMVSENRLCFGLFPQDNFLYRNICPFCMLNKK